MFRKRGTEQAGKGRKGDHIPVLPFFLLRFFPLRLVFADRVRYNITIMETIIRKLSGTDADRAVYEEAAAVIREEGLVAFPTETVYGLGGNGLDPLAASKIYAAKGRPSDNPLILHIAEREELFPLVREVPETALRLMERFWPGPLTLIFRKDPSVPDATTGGLPTVAVRMPSHPAARAFIRAAAVPIAAPSANLSGRPSPTSAAHVLADLDGRIPLILDGGEAEIGLESTIVDVSGGIPTVLRPGYIGLDRLRETLGTVAVDPAVWRGLGENERPKAPGMKYRHYAPQVPLTLVEGEDAERAAFIRRRAEEAAASGLRTGALISRETLPLYRQDDPNKLLLFPMGSRLQDAEIAHRLFAVLRTLDSFGLDHVYSETFRNGPLSEAIMNRLRKAAAFEIIDLSDEGHSAEVSDKRGDTV